MKAFLVGILLVPPVPAAQEKAVVYVHVGESGHELRLVRPGEVAVDARLVDLAGLPQNVFWDEGFDTLYYRVDETVFRMSWAIGGEPEPLLQQTPDAEELWIDADSGRFRAYEIQFPDSGAELRYRARIHEHRGGQGWQVLIERETGGCEAGDGSMCGEEVRSYRGGRRGIFLSDLHDRMRVLPHLDRLGIAFDPHREEEPQFLRSTLDANVGVELYLRMGDTLHGFAPVRWIDRLRSSKKEIFPGEPECGPQVGFEEYSRWVLVISEYTGRCARIVSLDDGQIVWRAPARASLAAWVPEPRSN